MLGTRQSNSYLPNTIWYLRPDGVETVARLHPELLDGITDSQIMDKSKSSGASKALVCLQATWFIAQCISRLAQALPISLLEVSAIHPLLKTTG